MPISKKDPDESIYTTWRGVGGARVYKSESDTSPIQITEQDMFFTVTKPDYTKEIADPADFAVFEEFAFTDADEMAASGIET